MAVNTCSSLSSCMPFGSPSPSANAALMEYSFELIADKQEL